MTARDPVELVLAALEAAGCKPHKSGDSWAAKCPAHEDRNPSLSISRGDDGRALLKDHAGCSTEAVVAALPGLGVRDLFAEEMPRTARRISQTYGYTDVDGRLLFEVVRFEPKDFRQRRPDGRGGWIWKLEGIEPVLYHMPAVLAAVKAGRHVFACEGERDCDNVVALGLAATTNPGGACKWRPALSEVLRAAKIIITPHNDANGVAHARMVAESLAGIAAEVRVLELAGLKPKGDISDWIVARQREGKLKAAIRAELVELAKAAPLAAEWMAAQAATEVHEPEPVDTVSPHLAALPDYPVDELPEPLRGLVEAGVADGLPAPYVGAGGLAALAYCARGCRLVVGARWTERPVLWLVALGAAGTAKSAAWRYGWPPIDHAESKLRAEWEEAVATWRSQPKKTRGDVPVPMTHVLTDTTPEALIRRLAAAGPQVVAVDELRGWLGGLGRYNNGGTEREIGLYLGCWDAGTPVHYDRVSGGLSLVAADPGVSVVGALVIEDARLLGGVESGFRARWLPHLGPLTVAAGSDATDHEPSPALQDWDRTVRELLATKPPSFEFRLTGDARHLWRESHDRWHAEAVDASPGVRSALHKADRHVHRVATCLAVGMGERTEIPTEAMSGAIAIVDYVMDVWRAIPEVGELLLSRTEERLSPAVDRLAAWLEQRLDGEARREQILRAQVAGARTKDALDALLARYEEVYPGSIVDGESSDKGGRRGKVVKAPRRAPARIGVPSDRRNSVPHREQGPREEKPENTGTPKERPEGTPPPGAPEGTPLPEGTPAAEPPAVAVAFGPNGPEAVEYGSGEDAEVVVL